MKLGTRFPIKNSGANVLRRPRIAAEKTLLTVGNSLFAMALMVALCSFSSAQTQEGGKPPLAGIRFGGTGDSSSRTPILRTLEGKVKDATGKDVQGATVYLKSMKTSHTLSMTTDEKGAFRFVALEKNVDYEFWAQAERQKSDPKTISSFDGTMKITTSLILR
jgi:Carboxypeptidase regulatory-like domain